MRQAAPTGISTAAPTGISTAAPTGISTAASTVSRVLKRFGAAYLRCHGARMTAQQKKTLRAVMACREDSLGTIRYVCACCGAKTSVPRSCCNRHCPACQHQRQQHWLESAKDRLLPCQYFLVTFTLPSQLRDAAMRNPKVVYGAMMQAASESIREAATNTRHVGAVETGFTSVLHTWGRDLSYHPHVHVMVSAGGIDRDGDWQSSRVSVFVPEQILEQLFRSKLQSKLQSESFYQAIDSTIWNGRFVVDSKNVGDGKSALAYLAPYIVRGAVSNWRVTACDETACDEAESLESAQLTLQVKRSGSRQYRPMRMRVEEFIRRWLHHVLPSGLHRVRHYGFANCRSKRSIEEVRLLVAIALGKLHYLASSIQVVLAESTKMQCPECQGPMISLGYFPPSSDFTAASARAPPSRMMH